MTREHALLRHAIEQLHKVPLKEERGPQERMHLKTLFCKYESEEGSQELSFIQSFIIPIQKWADKQLTDYHLHFPEVHNQIMCNPFCFVNPLFFLHCFYSILYRHWQ